MDKDEVLKQLQSEIADCKNRIDELSKQGRDTDKVFYLGRLQAYENVLKWLSINE